MRRRRSDGAHPADRFAALEQREVGVEFGGGLVALLEFGVAGADDDFVQLGELGAFGGGLFDEIRWQLGVILAVAASGHFVEHFAEAEDVGLRRARAFGRQITFRADQRERGLGPRDESDVRQLGNAVHEDDVRRFDVAVDEAVAVQVIERGSEGEADLQAFVEREAAAVEEIGAESAGRVNDES